MGGSSTQKAQHQSACFVTLQPRVPINQAMLARSPAIRPQIVMSANGGGGMSKNDKKHIREYNAKLF